MSDSIPKYKINVEWSSADGEYVATTPAFPHISGLSKDRSEAVSILEGVILDCVQICKEDSIPIPAEDAAPEYSGKLMLRMPKTMHKELSVEAETEGVSLNQYIGHILSARGKSTQSMSTSTIPIDFNYRKAYK